MAVLSVTSKTLADRLRSMGVTERKSLTAVVDKALAFDRYFWLGVIDADGCVFHNRTRPGVRYVDHILWSANSEMIWCRSSIGFRR